MEKINIFWFRRDLRLKDNAGLYHALKSGKKVLPIFIFDSNILDKLPNKADKRLHFIHNTITSLSQDLQKLNSSLHVFHGTPTDVFKTLTTKYKIDTVFTNHDYEPYAKSRDAQVSELLLEHDIHLKTFKDQVIFERSEVTKDDHTPYTIYTPYMKKWRSKLTDFHLKPYPTQKYFKNLLATKPTAIPTLKTLGFIETDADFPPSITPKKIIENYHNTRDFPAQKGTSHLGVHLRFGTISIRQLAAHALKTNQTYLNELIWRDFYMMILHHFPYVTTGAFKKKYDKLKWLNNPQQFEAWKNGQTGYPIVDAGMRELNATGYMHNRLRMITASFLVKHLLIDWRWGEKYFAEKLLDFELSSNNGGWQWAAGTGCDAAPYFRIFNPESQTKKFDPELKYIKKWVPELETLQYPNPIVEHKAARARTLLTYSQL